MTLLPGFEVTEKIGGGFTIVLFQIYRLRNKQPGILKVPILVLEDFSRPPPNNLTTRIKTDLETISLLAIQVSATPGEIRQNDLNHNHIDLGNLHFNPDTKQAKITTFGDALRVTGEKLSW